MSARRTLGSNAGTGLGLAGVTALTSGVSVYVNSYGVRAVPDAAVYTTAKNLVAAVLLVGVAVVARRREARAIGAVTRRAASRRPGSFEVLGLVYVAVVGGGLAFVAFFVGLSRMAAEPAAFLHDTLVVWVALIAWPALRERLTPANLCAIVLLVGGQVALLGGVGSLVVGGGLALVLGATLLWAVETVVARRLLATVSPASLGVVRMAGGGAVLLAYLGARGSFTELAHLGTSGLGWVLLCGLLLSVYVGTWFAALSRARAIDVTSILVLSVLVTAALQDLAGAHLGAHQLLGLALVAGGVGATALAAARRALA